MAAILLTASCPAVYVPTGFTDLDAAENSTGTGGANVLRKFSQGQVDDVPDFLNRNVASQELLGRFGAGANAVCYGCELYAGVGLIVSVADGHVLASGGVVQINADDVAALPDNTRSYLWVLDNLDGTFGFIHATTTARPTDAVVFLGSVLTASGSVVSVDYSRVLRFYGGIPWCETADLGAPTDSPPSNVVLIQRTLAGSWLWDGTDWALLQRGLAHQSLSVPSGKTETVPSGRQAVVHGSFDVVGTLDVYGDFLVLE